MEFKGTKGKWEHDLNDIFNQTNGAELCSIWGCGKSNEGFALIAHIDKSPGIVTAKANALLISKSPQMLEMIQDLAENLALQLDRLGCCGEGDGRGRKADNDSFGGAQLLAEAKALIKSATEL